MRCDPPRVLVVDPSADMVESLGMLLRLSGFDPCIAGDCRTALARAHDNRPAAVIVETAAADCDLRDLARQLRAAARPEDLLLVALTCRSDLPHRRATREAGFDYFMVKGEGMGELLQLLASRAGREVV